MALQTFSLHSSFHSADNSHPHTYTGVRHDADDRLIHYHVCKLNSIRNDCVLHDMSVSRDVHRVWVHPRQHWK